MSLYSRGSASLSRSRAASVGAVAPVAVLNPLVGLGAVAALVIGSRWITMRGHAVLISEEGRIAGGDVPVDWQGIHIHDVSGVSHDVRELEADRDECETAPKRQTFASTEIGVSQLLEANPELENFLEVECSNDCDQFRGWIRGGRLGPKPKADPHDGRFDLVNEQFEKRKPGQKVASWLEAVYTTVPKSRRWEDFGPRLATLSEATGVSINLPPEAERIELHEEDVAECQAAADDRIDNLLTEAREGRHGQAGAVEGVPF